MSTRCKPGDLAVYVQGIPENVGAFVEVLDYAGFSVEGAVAWTVRVLCPVTSYFGGVFPAGSIKDCLDSSLQPIRPRKEPAGAIDSFGLPADQRNDVPSEVAA